MSFIPQCPAPVPGQPAGGDYGYDWGREPPKMHGTLDHPGYVYYGDGSLHQVMDAAGTTEVAHYTYTPAGLTAQGSR